MEAPSDFVVNQVSDIIDMSTFNEPSFSTSDQCIESEVIEIKPPSRIASSETFVVEPRHESTAKSAAANVENRQNMAVKSFIERPQIARDRLAKNLANNKMVLPHELGALPKYLRARKDKVSTSSSIEQLRPETCDSLATKKSDSSIKVQIKLTPQQEKYFKGDAKSITSATDMHKTPAVAVEEVEMMKKKIAAQAKTISRDKTQIQDLKHRSMTLEKQCEELQTALERVKSELKSSTEQNKALEMRFVRSRMDQKELEASAGKGEKLHSEIDALTREKNELSFELAKITKVKSDEILNLKRQIDQLSSELKMQRSSCETLICEKNELQMLLRGKGSCANKEDGDKITAAESEVLMSKIELLEREIHSRVTEISAVKEDNRLLSEQIHHLKSKLKSSSKDSSDPEEVHRLQQKVNQLKIREEELCRQIILLKSQLDNEKCSNNSKEILLKHRADHIRTLQDADNVSNARIILQIKEIEELRGVIKTFEKFKLAHAEERDNFANLLKQCYK